MEALKWSGRQRYECVVRLARRTAVTRFKHQVGSIPTTLTTLVELGLRVTAGLLRIIALFTRKCKSYSEPSLWNSTMILAVR